MPGHRMHGEDGQRPVPDLVTMAIGTMEQRPAPGLGRAGQVRQPVAHALGQDEAPRGDLGALRQAKLEGVGAARNLGDEAGQDFHSAISGEVGADARQNVQGRHTVPARHAMGRGRHAVTRRARIDDRHRPRELQRGRQTGKAASDNDDVAHDRSFRSDTLTTADARHSQPKKLLESRGSCMKRNSRLSLALHSLGHMAGDPDRMRPSTEITAHVGTNPVVVRRVLGRLRAAGLLIAEKGHSGGWRLARPPETITFADVYEALGECLAPDTEEETSCCAVQHALESRMAAVLTDVERGLLAGLATITIAQAREPL